MPPRAPLPEFPLVPIYERPIYEGQRTESFSEEREQLRNVLVASGQVGYVLVEVSSRSQWEKGYHRGPGPGDTKTIVVRALFRNEVMDEMRIGRPAFLQPRRERKAVKKMAQLVIDKRQQTKS